LAGQRAGVPKRRPVRPSQRNAGRGERRDTHLGPTIAGTYVHSPPCFAFFLLIGDSLYEPPWKDSHYELGTEDQPDASRQDRDTLSGDAVSEASDHATNSRSAEDHAAKPNELKR